MTISISFFWASVICLGISALFKFLLKDSDLAMYFLGVSGVCALIARAGGG